MHELYRWRSLWPQHHHRRVFNEHSVACKKKKHLVSWRFSWLNRSLSTQNQSLQEAEWCADTRLHAHSSCVLTSEPWSPAQIVGALKYLKSCAECGGRAWTAALLLPGHSCPPASCLLRAGLLPWFGIYIPVTGRTGNRRTRGNIARISPPVVMQTLIPLKFLWQLLNAGVCTLLEYLI